MCETEEEVRTYSLKELEGSARERAYDRLRRWNTDYDWFEDTRKDWAENTLPDDWCIHYCDPDQMYFDCGNGGFIALTNGCLNLQELATKKPEWFENIAIRMLLITGNLYSPKIWIAGGRYSGTRGVNDLEFHVCLTGTPFDGMDEDEFVALMDGPISDLQANCDQWAKDAAAACLQALSDEYDHLTSDECIEEMAEANDYRFDEDGEVVR